MADTYTGAKTFTVTTTTQKFVGPKVRKILIVENTGENDIWFGFWANLSASPTGANSDTTGSGAGIKVAAGAVYFLDMTANAVLIAQDSLYMVSSGGDSTVNVISLF